MKWAQWFFLFTVSGFVIYEILSEFHSSKAMLLFAPKYVVSYFQIQDATASSLIQSVFLFIIYPGVIWFTPYGIIRLFGTKISIKYYLTYFGLAFIPIVAGAHFSKALLKMSSRIPYLKYLEDDFIGIKTAQVIVNKEIVLQKLPDWSIWMLSIVAVATMLLSYIVSLKIINRVMQKLEISENKFLFQMITFAYFLILVRGTFWKY